MVKHSLEENMPMRIFSEDMEKSVLNWLENTGRELFRSVAEKEANTKDYRIPKEFCEYMGIVYGTYKLWKTKYQLPTVQIEGKIYISKTSFHEWMKQHEEIFYEK